MVKTKPKNRESGDLGSIHGFRVEGSGGEPVDSSRVPRMVARIQQCLDELPDVLISSRRLSEKLRVTHGALLMHTANPALRPYRYHHGATILWSNKSSIATLHAKEANL